VAEIDCPVCRKVVARLVVSDRGELRVIHRLIGIETRSDRSADVVVRPWNTSDVPFPGRKSLAYWESTCSSVRCNGRFVLDVLRVRQLEQRARAVGYPIRWHPDGAAIERSERLRPMLHFVRLPEPVAILHRLAMTKPSPLADADVRPAARVRV
jgi:hypothetical protein